MNYYNWILNYKLSAEQDLNEADNVIYQPPPLHMSGLMKLDINKVTRITSNSTITLMGECNQAIKWIIPTPVNTGKDANNNPDM
jgi:hypothetical protein